MTDARFLQIHWLASYPGTLLNRDDAGLAKRLPFGGATRARVSSQSLKRHWRFAGADDHERAKDNRWALQTLAVPMGVRTKLVVENRVMPRALERQPARDEVVEAVTGALLKAVYGEKAEDPKKRQALYLGEPEIEFLAGLAAEGLGAPDAKTATEMLEGKKKEKGKDEKASKGLLAEQRQNLRALEHGAGLGAALFGRMVTSDPAANTDAAIHVAHAMTVHAMERDLDFMTVVDDLKSREEGDDAGAAGVFDMELTSGIYYGYVVVDIGLLAANLAGDREIAARVVEHLVHLIAEVSPGAKKGSTAPYAWAEWMLVEAGDRQPRTLANAFRDPVDLRSNRLLGTTVERLGKHLAGLDAAYGTGEARRQMAADPEASLDGMERTSLDALAGWAAGVVRTGEAA